MAYGTLCNETSFAPEARQSSLKRQGFIGPSCRQRHRLMMNIIDRSGKVKYLVVPHATHSHSASSAFPPEDPSRHFFL
jgi:hypothetical protein